MSEYYDNIKVGDEIYVESYTGMGASSAGKQTVTGLETKYDEDTGGAYTVICLGDHKFDGRHGGAINSPTMYFISKE